MLNFTTDSKNLYCTGGYFFRNFAGRPFRREIILILLIAAVLFGAAAISAAGEQCCRPVVNAKDKSAVAQQAGKHSIGRVPKPTLQSEAETIASMGKTYKPEKSIRPNRPNRTKPKSSGLEFMEVEIALGKQFTIEYIKALPKAPGSDLEVVDGGKRVRVQLAASQVNALVKKKADVVVLKKFILVEGFKGKGGKAAGRGDDMATLRNTSVSYSNCYGSNGTNVPIPEASWTYSSIYISCAAGGATVTSIDVHYEIIHPCRSDLNVDLTDEDLSCEYHLWTNPGHCQTPCVANINETVTGIMVCNGELVNQSWLLWAMDVCTLDTGYIKSWWIKVYYEDYPPPVNDDCLDAIAVTESVAYFGSSVYATGGYESSCGFNDTADVWHKFIPSSSGNYMISLRDSGFDTTLVVFDYCGGPELVCNDDISYPSNVQSEVAIDLTGGNTYYIRVAGYDGETGSYKLLVEPCPTPANDECVNAIAVTEGAAYDGSTVGATGVYESSCSLNDTADVWHSYTATSTGIFTIDLAGSGFDTTLAVFDYCGGTELACNDDISYPSNPQSEITMRVVGAQTYLIRIAGYEFGTGDYTLSVVCTPCTLPPEPNNPSPVSGANDVALDTILSWNGGGAKAVSAGGIKAASSESGDSIVTPKVIYGNDDRLEEYEVTDGDILAAGDSTVAILHKDVLINNGDGTFSLPTETYAEWYKTAPVNPDGHDLCFDEPFYDQPVPAFCSGFLVSEDIVATAGHCANFCSCENLAFVFGFVMLDASTPVLTIDASEIYYCSEVIASTALGSDWALIRLDREVLGHSPLRVRVTDAADNGEPLLVVGHPVGLPRKYAGGAEVKSSNVLSPFFQANVDTYIGNSGSAVFNANTLEVEGILVSGNPDWVEDGSCDRSKVCPDSGCPTWEDVTRTTEFTHLFPWERYDVYFGTTDPPTELIYSDLDEPTCMPYDPCNPGETLTPDTTYYWQIVAKNSCGETPGPNEPDHCWQFTTFTCTAPGITGWEIAATHGGSVGEIWCEVNDGYIEPRTCGIAKLRVCFDQAMNTDINDPNVISIEGEDNGVQPPPCSIEWDGSSCMIIKLCSALPDANTYTITVGTEVESSAGYALVGDRNICVIALKGDANRSLEVNAQDMLAIRPHAGDPVDCNNARYDINYSGAINAQDMLAVRPNAGHTAAQCPN